MQFAKISHWLETDSVHGISKYVGYPTIDRISSLICDISARSAIESMIALPRRY